MKIEILVGMIASGKTTYARSRAKEGALIVSHDDLTEMLHGEYRYEAGLRECYREIEDNIVRAAVRVNRDVVVDRTHLTRESRRRWLDIAELSNLSMYATLNGRIAIEAIVFPLELPRVHASRRHLDDSRGRTYGAWLEVANHHYGQALAEPLTDDEGFSEIIRI